MSRPHLYSKRTGWRICFMAGVIVLCTRISGLAGVGVPPMPGPDNTNAKAQYFANIHYEAQKSNEEKIRVGKERYEEMLSNRAGVLQVMNGELAERQKSVVLQPAPAVKVEKSQLQTQNITLIGVVITGLAFLGFRHFLNRQEAKNATAK